MRVKLKNGMATVDKSAQPELITTLDRLCDLAKKQFDMNHPFFVFCHAIYQQDKDLIKSPPEQAYTICNMALGAYLKSNYITPQSWVAECYDDWIKNGFVSDHMPDKCKKIIQGE